VRVVGQGEQAVVRVHFGDGAHATGVSASGPTGTAYTPKAIAPDTTHVLRMDTRCGLHVHAKLWAVGTPMPTAWDVTADLEETEDEGDRLEVWGRTTSDSGTMELAICRLRIATFAAPGERVEERIGTADGGTSDFPTSHRYERGTLRAFIDGFGVPPATQAPSAHAFATDRIPARKAPVRATYVAD
jgi:hypothetical protein